MSSVVNILGTDYNIDTTTHIDLSSKTFPESISLLTNLRVLNLHGNKINDIPNFIWSLTNLQNLNLSANQITSVSDSILSLTNLQHLDLSYNQITKHSRFYFIINQSTKPKFI